MPKKALGVQLLDHTTRKVVPTQAGELYFDKAQHIIDDTISAHGLVKDFGQGGCGKVRIWLPVDFADELIVPLIPQFCAQCPDVKLLFDLNSHKVDLVSEPYDMAIRL